MAEPNTPKAEKKFKLSLVVFDKEFASEGDTVIEALQTIEPGFIKARGMWILKDGERKSTMLMFPPVIKKLLVNKVFQQIFEKRMLTTLQ